MSRFFKIGSFHTVSPVVGFKEPVAQLAGKNLSKKQEVPTLSYREHRGKHLNSLW